MSKDKNNNKIPKTNNKRRTAKKLIRKTTEIVEKNQGVPHPN